MRRIALLGPGIAVPGIHLLPVAVELDETVAELTAPAAVLAFGYRVQVRQQFRWQGHREAGES